MILGRSESDRAGSLDAAGPAIWKSRLFSFPSKNMPRRRSRSVSRSLDVGPKSPARGKRKDFNFSLFLKSTVAWVSYILFYLATLSESYKSRRELFAPIQCFAIVFSCFSSALHLGFDNLGLRFLSAVLTLASVRLFVMIYCLSHRVVAKADVKKKQYTSSAAKNYDICFPALYVAHTGYNNTDGSPIYGVYASRFIPNG